MKSDLQISANHLKEVKGILEVTVPTSTVWAFGSRATQNAKQYSDLDLAIYSERPITLETMSVLREAFDESNLPWKVDFVDYSVVSNNFKKIIDRNKIRVL